MANISSLSQNSTSPLIEKKGKSGEIVRELSDFLVSLIERGNQPSSEGAPRQDLLYKIKLISGDSPSVENGEKAVMTGKTPSLALEHSENLIEWKKALFLELESENLTDREKEFCKQLINNYLATPGYKKYQSYARALWKKSYEGIDLQKIQTFFNRKESEINIIKENNETEYRLFKRAFEPTLEIAKQIHEEFNAQFSHEQKPRFDPTTLQVECSLEQLEFACQAAHTSFAQFMRKARNPKQIAYVTRLIQMILCGEEANIPNTLPMNPLCFMLRETVSKSSSPVQIGSIEENSNLLFKPRNPHSCALSGQLDICLPGWEHPFDREWERGPIACVDTSFQNPSSSAGQAPFDEDAPPSGLVMRNLCVNWAAPRAIREHLVSYIIDPQSVPHELTHPLTGKNLNRFADQVAALFQILSIEDSQSLPLDSFSPSERLEHRRKIQEASELIETMKIEACRELEEDEKDELGPFIDRCIEIITSGSSETVFLRGLRELTEKKEYEEGFLKQLFSLLSKHAPALQTLSQCHQQFRKCYHGALEESVSQNHLFLRKAFAEEYEPVADLKTGSVTCSFARFRLAKQLFDSEYQWLIEFAGNKEEKAMASHILASLLCGKDAPVCERLLNNPRCFVIREFADGSVESLSKAIAVADGSSYGHQLFNEVAGQGEPSEEAQFKASFAKAAQLLVNDAVVRNRYHVTVGRDHYTTQFANEADLRKPFYLIEILNRYIEFLKGKPDQAQQIRKTHFAILVNKYLTINKFRDILLPLCPPGHPEKAVQQLTQYLEAVPKEFQDLVLLKLVELMIFMSQHMAIVFGSFLQSICEEPVHEENGYSITYNAHSNFNYHVDPSKCDALVCRANIELIHQKPAVKFTTAKNKTVHIIVPQTCAAQMEFRMEIPSMIEVDHTRGTNCPSLSFSRLAVSAFVPVSLLDSLSLDMNRAYISDEIASHFRQEGLKLAFEKMIQDLSGLDQLLENLDEAAIIRFSLSKFLAAYKIIKKMEIQLSLQTTSGDKEATRLLNQQIKQSYQALKPFYRKLEAKYKDKDPSREVINFFTQIRLWFPAFISKK